MLQVQNIMGSIGVGVAWLISSKPLKPRAVQGFCVYGLPSDGSGLDMACAGGGRRIAWGDTC
jgi:hypothetical protein